MMFKFRRSLVGGASIVDPSTLPIQKLASYVLDREIRWFALAWKEQSAMWLHHRNEFTIIKDGLIITAPGTPTLHSGVPSIYVHVIPFVDPHDARVRSGIYQHSGSDPRTWAFNWSRDKQALLLLRGSSILYVSLCEKSLLFISPSP